MFCFAEKTPRFNDNFRYNDISPSRIYLNDNYKQLSLSSMCDSLLKNNTIQLPQPVSTHLETIADLGEYLGRYVRRCTADSV